MWLIDRHSDGLVGWRKALPLELRKALVRWYVGEGTHKDEEAGIVLVQQARIGECWIACDCLPPDKAPPILTPAYLSEAETYYLRRLTGSGRSEHRPECPFFRDHATNRVSEQRSRQTPAAPPAGFFEVIKPAPANLAQRPESDSVDDRTRHASVPRLARLLWRLMNAAGVNHTPPYAEDFPDRSIATEFKALIGAAGQMEIAPAMQLARAFWTHAQPLHSKRIYATLRELGRQWPRDHAPQGFLALYANAFQAETIYAAGSEPVVIANRVQSPSVRGNLIKGPYLVLVVVGQYPEARGFAPLRAYAQPIYSGQRFVPVDSNFEREVYRGLLGVRRDLHRAGVDLAINKPVFDRLTDLGTCRPDFILEARSRSTGEIRQLVVEAMGFATPEYLDAKRVTHPRMERIAPVVAVTPADVESGRLSHMLRTALNI
ncbi:hypothetical protein FHS96_005320 [Sphingomonas zeicaulis]|uniref:hypothetical protein n=1 Tax=Sphingomonas zeicaulis TaxID=1632740 RepID=UPI003D223676